MGLVSRVAWLVAALALVGIAGCGGSVADADRDRSRATRDAAPQSQFCAAVQANSAAIRPLNGLTARGGAPPEELRNSVDAVRRTGAELLYTAPQEIRADVQRTVDALNLQLDALIDAGGNAAAVARDPQLAARLNNPESTAASRRVTSYVEENCGAAAAGSR